MNILHNFLKKKWTDQDITELIGSYDDTFLSYALNDRIRYGGASGGTVTAILAYALDQGLISGALVCRTKIVDYKIVRPEFYIATHSSELLTSQDSKYVETNFVPQAIKLIDGFPGKLAVVGLPCDLKVLRKLMVRKDSFAAKIILTIGLFCGHNSQRQLIDNVITKLAPSPSERLEFFRFRIGLWRG
jgi:coenzyme F420 hydrogenase subunit beta